MAARGAGRQQSAMPAVGLLYAGDLNADADLAAVLRNGLHDAGYIEDQNVVIEGRTASPNTGRIHFFSCSSSGA